jgi:hypothetical protein
MLITTFIPLLIIIALTFFIVKPLPAKKTLAIWSLGVALFIVAGFTGFLFGDMSRMYSMNSKTYKLIKNTSASLTNENCEETTLVYNDAIVQLNSGTPLDEAIDYIIQNVED